MASARFTAGCAGSRDSRRIRRFPPPPRRRGRWRGRACRRRCVPRWLTVSARGLRTRRGGRSAARRRYRRRRAYARAGGRGPCRRRHDGEPAGFRLGENRIGRDDGDGGVACRVRAVAAKSSNFVPARGGPPEARRATRGPHLVVERIVRRPQVGRSRNHGRAEAVHRDESADGEAVPDAPRRCRARP